MRRTPLKIGQPPSVFFIQMKDHPSEFNFSSEGIRSDQLKLKILHMSRAKQFKL